MILRRLAWSPGAVVATCTRRHFAATDNNRRQQQQQQQQRDAPASECPRAIGCSLRNDAFEVQRDVLGTGRFVAHGASPARDTTLIVAVCDVPHRTALLRERRVGALVPADAATMAPSASAAERARRRALARRHRAGMFRDPGGDNTDAASPSPLHFTVTIADYAPRPAFSGSLIVSASAVAGALVVDAVQTAPDASRTLGLERSVEALVRRRGLYGGPSLHQGLLAQHVLGAGFAAAPLAPARQAAELFLRPQVAADWAAAARCGHQPVHTVPPHLYAAVTRWLAALGVDDCFARGMRDTALVVAEEEHAHWRREVTPLLQRVTYK